MLLTSTKAIPIKYLTLIILISYHNNNLHNNKIYPTLKYTKTVCLLWDHIMRTIHMQNWCIKNRSKSVQNGLGKKSIGHLYLLVGKWFRKPKIKNFIAIKMILVIIKGFLVDLKINLLIYWVKFNLTLISNQATYMQLIKYFL